MRGNDFRYQGSCGGTIGCSGEKSNSLLKGFQHHHLLLLYQQVGKDNPLAEYLALAEKKTGLSRNKLLAIGGTAGDSITITITITITWSITIIITNILIIIIISRCCSGGWICSSASLRSHRLSLPSILFCQVDILYCCKNRFYHSFLITISSISIMITTLHLIQGPGEQTERRGAQVFNKNLLNLFRGTMHKLLFNLVILLNSIIHGEFVLVDLKLWLTTQ